MLQSHIGWDFSMPTPRGGRRHAQEIGDLLNALRNCRDIYAEKGCTECPKASQPDPKAVEDLKKLIVLFGVGGALATAPELAPLLPLVPKLAPQFVH